MNRPYLEFCVVKVVHGNAKQLQGGCTCANVVYEDKRLHCLVHTGCALRCVSEQMLCTDGRCIGKLRPASHKKRQCCVLAQVNGRCVVRDATHDAPCVNPAKVDAAPIDKCRDASHAKYPLSSHKKSENVKIGTDKPKFNSINVYFEI